MRVTTEQRAYIKAHLNDRPRAAVAKAAGVSIMTLYTIVRELGGEIDYSLCARHPEWWDEYIREHYPNESALQIAQAIGSIKSRVNKIAAKLGVRHSDEYLTRERELRNARLDACRAKIDYKAQAAKWRHTRHMDEVRVCCGLPRKTKFRFKQITARSYKAKWYLMKRYNYFEDEDNAYVLYYDDETRRIINEEYYTKKYKLDFKPA